MTKLHFGLSGMFSRAVALLVLVLALFVLAVLLSFPSKPLERGFFGYQATAAPPNFANEAPSAHLRDYTTVNGFNQVIVGGFAGSPIPIGGGSSNSELAGRGQGSFIYTMSDTRATALERRNWRMQSVLT
jgi:hypothetical protein